MAAKVMNFAFIREKGFGCFLEYLKFHGCLRSREEDKRVREEEAMGSKEYNAFKGERVRV